MIENLEKVKNYMDTYNKKPQIDSKDEMPKVDIPFPISLEYGSIGFRNDGDENALIKEVLIKKL